MRREPPIIISVLSSLLFVDGVLALLGSLFYMASRSERLFGVIVSLSLIVASVAVFMNLGQALRLSFGAAVLLTIDEVREFILGLYSTGHRTLPGFKRLVLAIALYWTAYLAYRSWFLSKNQSEK